MASKNDLKLSIFTTIHIFATLFSVTFTETLSSPQLQSTNNRLSASPTIYDLLKAHALPPGIFPKGISEFSLDPTSGRFELRRSRSCAAQFETDVWFDVTVTGTLSYGQISNLSGMAAQELFLWFPVNEIRVDIPSSGLIYFDVGVVSKQFSLSFFEIPQDCTVDDTEKLSSSSLRSLPWPPRGNIISINDRGRIIENQSRKLVKQSFQWQVAGRAVS
ncbi:hypothetical protein DM860_014114 [Cuscuta australis]|uniref:Uncharacterized protein n=1 Tax=Cuscuta australis TaxID=267555 RepID=A0A328DE24_9ASTE|nr:hypothetical protein DM860_014114 [Cuscuta australis]